MNNFLRRLCAFRRRDRLDREFQEEMQNHLDMQAVKRLDLFGLVAGPSLLAGVALPAAIIPAWRAARIGPMPALRAE
ncbi:MAG TPA: hypothetical protein VML19_25280 [Verrucomicrobiae bacterium]|nr:hypothetical protein [Verrucomicrobiae bacterium]